MMINLTGVIDTGTVYTAGVPQNPRRTIRVIKGVTTTVGVEVVYPTGVGANLAGFTATLTIRKRPDLDIVLEVAGTIDGSRATFDIERDDLRDRSGGRYLYDVVVENGGDRESVIPLSPLILEEAVAAIP